MFATPGRFGKANMAIRFRATGSIWSCGITLPVNGVRVSVAALSSRIINYRRQAQKSPVRIGTVGTDRIELAAL